MKLLRNKIWKLGDFLGNLIRGSGLLFRELGVQIDLETRSCILDIE